MQRQSVGLKRPRREAGQSKKLRSLNGQSEMPLLNHMDKGRALTFRTPHGKEHIVEPLPDDPTELIFDAGMEALQEASSSEEPE